VNYPILQINSRKYSFLEQNLSLAEYLLGYGSITKPGHITVGLKLPISSHGRSIAAWEKELCRVYLMAWMHSLVPWNASPSTIPKMDIQVLRLRPEHQNGIHAAPKSSLIFDRLVTIVGNLPDVSQRDTSVWTREFICSVDFQKTLFHSEWAFSLLPAKF
jgi:hypothetical protein